MGLECFPGRFAKHELTSTLAVVLVGLYTRYALADASNNLTGADPGANSVSTIMIQRRLLDAS